MKKDILVNIVVILKIKSFTAEEKVKYLNKLNEHKELLLNTHDKNYDYKKLLFKLYGKRNAKI